jgi:hypothetical protein
MDQFRRAIQATLIAFIQAQASEFAQSTPQAPEVAFEYTLCCVVGKITVCIEAIRCIANHHLRLIDWKTCSGKPSSGGDDTGHAPCQFRQWTLP